MIIRSIEKHDVKAVVELGAEMHRLSAFSFLPYDKKKAFDFVKLFIENREDFICFVAEDKGNIVGMIGGEISEYFFCHELILNDWALFVLPSQRSYPVVKKLINRFVEWGIQEGVREICIGISTGVDTDRVGTLFKRSGFACVGGVYKKRVR